VDAPPAPGDAPVRTGSCWPVALASTGGRGCMDEVAPNKPCMAGGKWPPLACKWTLPVSQRPDPWTLSIATAVAADM